MKKRFLVLLFLLAIVLVPFTKVNAEEIDTNLINNNQINNEDVSSNETSDDSSDEEKNNDLSLEDDDTTNSDEKNDDTVDSNTTENDENELLKNDDSNPTNEPTEDSEKVTLTYDLNGGEPGEYFKETVTITKDDELTLSAPPEEFIKAPEGYSFNGIEVDGEQYLIDEEGVINITFTKDCVVKLLWKEIFVITEVEITLTPPLVGETNDMDQGEDEEGNYYWNWSSQTNPPVATSPEDSHYTVEYTYWIMGWKGEEYDTPFVGTFERDTEYHAEIVVYSEEGYQFSEDVVVTVNGEAIDALIYRDNFYDDNGHIVSEMSIGKLIKAFEYLIIDGDNQTHVAYKDGDLVVTSNGDADKLVELQVDKNTLDPSNYTIESGSTIATVNREYLDNLDAGSHKLTFVYTNGEVSANFNVIKTNNPQTLDIIQVWYMLMVISVMGLGFGVLQLRKNN